MNKKELKYNYDHLEQAYNQGLSDGVYQPNSHTFEEFFAKNFVESEPEPVSEVRKQLLIRFKVDLKFKHICIPKEIELTSEELLEIKEMGLHVQYNAF